MSKDESPIFRDEHGEFTNERMANAWYWGAQVAGWLSDGPNTIDGDHYVEIIGGDVVIALDGEKFNQDSAQALISGLRGHGFPEVDVHRELQTRNEYRIFIAPTDDRLVSNYISEWKQWEPHDGFEDTEPSWQTPSKEVESVESVENVERAEEPADHSEKANSTA